MDTTRQVFIDKTATPGTLLGCVPRVHQYETATSTFCLVRSELYQLIPGSVSNAFSQAMVKQHSFAVQPFKGDDTKLINQPATEFVSKVLAPVSDALVDMTDDLVSLSSKWRALFLFGKPSLRFSQCLFILAKEAGIGNLLASGKSCKRLKPNINTYRLFRLRQWLRLNLTAKAGIPFARAVPTKREGLRLAFKRAVNDSLNQANLGGFDMTIFKPKAELWVGEAIIATFTSKARVARLLPGLNAAKEGLKSKINSFLDILKCLGIDHCQSGAFKFPLRKKYIGLIQTDRLLFHLPGILTKCKRLIKYPPAFFKHLTHNALLMCSGVDTILECLTHTVILAYANANIKRGGKGQFIPPLKQGAFLP